VIKTIETQGTPASSGLKVPGETGIAVQEQDQFVGVFLWCFPSKCPSLAPGEMINSPH
jgi:hypothetical protein